MIARSEAPIPPSLSDAQHEWTRFVTAVMAHSSTMPDRLAALGAAAPDAPGFLAAKGLAFLLLGRREPTREAAALYARAVRQTPAEGSHDGLLVAALGAFVEGRPSRAAAICDEILTRFPADGFALKMAQAIRFLYGDTAGMNGSVAAAIEGFGPDHPHIGYAHGCLAFAAEEAGDYHRAERAGRRAIELAPDDAWALHAVAHVHEMRGEAAAGRAWLLDRPKVFADCNNFRHHVWWHRALFELELGAVDTVLDLYDTEIRREKTDDYRDIANAVSLLARLEAEGVEVGTRWDELAALAEARIEDGCMVFADLHYLMALLGSGRGAAADRLVARLTGADDGTEFGVIAAEVGAPAADGLSAFARGRHADALRGLLAARRDLNRIGGSHAQRDVFERLTIDAALRAENVVVARSLIEDRARRRGAWDRFARDRMARCVPAVVAAPPAVALAF
ncbi:tetratricopeptide repeat protein [Acuticoccus sp. M5D2P5]|uniref:tetratricopeptide repeat protein n=1 Tax=Acuticoccus kalidii TaxID=2910977 RepID=UPI001F372977|nr:tetratricopeptide repeat protein [Acuticoccus kalidii]MCF3935416.1 tetratricopeptide repeat protein [Acuticoccus kalidii]